MISRMRLRVGIHLSALMLIVGMALVAEATQPVTRSQMESYAQWLFGTGLTTMAGAFWVLVNWINNKTRETLAASIDRVEKQVANLTALMHEHHIDPLAHPLGSANRIDPINEKLERMHDDLTQLIAEHRVIRGSEDEVCALVRMMAQKRDPADSPKPKRQDDPNGVDHRPERGKL